MSDLLIYSGAEFSECRKFRFALWRIWNESLPYVMFIGLNPSTANETEADPTIKSVIRIAKHNGFGGVYMMNCFPFVSTDPNQLEAYRFDPTLAINDERLSQVRIVCSEVVFAWGNFPIVQKLGRDKQLVEMFPEAKALHINQNGSPKHPLYCRSNSALIPYRNHG